MKTYVLAAMAFCLALTCSSGKIINAYDKDIETALASLKHLTRLPQEKSVLTRLEVIREFILYHELTRVLLEQFKMISPGLYQQIDTIRDFHGRPVDVYVKFLPTSGIQAGTVANTNLNQQEDDEHEYVSQYGRQSVSVEILVVKHSLRILAHEFGHVSYQVPNLSSYMKFFKRNYTDLHMRATYLGHKPNDPSGQRAEFFEQAFRADLLKFEPSNKSRTIDPVVLKEQLRKNIALTAKRF